MISVSHYHPLRAVDECRCPCGVRGESAPKSVFLYVGFVHHIHAVFVAKLIPPFGVGIMAGAHGVDVALLHQSDVLHHAFLRHYVSRFRVHLMAVHSAQPHLLSVHEHHTVFYLHLAESHLRLGPLHRISGRVGEGEFQRV